MRKAMAVFVTLALSCALPAVAGWDEGVAAFSKKDYQAAAAEFQKLADQQPESHRIQYMLGMSLSRLKRKEEALNHLSKAYNLDPNNAAYKLELAKAYFSVRRYQETVELLNKIDIGSLPVAHRSALYQMRGEAKRKNGDESGAYRDYQELAKLEPKNATIQYTYGAVALKVDQLDAAIRAFDAAVRLDPNDASMKDAYAKALLRKGRMTPDKSAKKTAYIKAAELAADLVKADPSFDNLMTKMSAEIGAGLFDQAVATGQAAQRKNSKDWLVPFYIGQAHTQNDKYSEAAAALQQALQLANPADQKTVWKQIGFAYEKQKKYADAISAYQNAGDQGGVTRVRENQETAKYNEQVEAENAQIEAMKEEAERLEAEMKKLSESGGGGL